MRRSWSIRESAKHAAALVLQSERTERLLGFIELTSIAVSGPTSFAATQSAVTGTVRGQDSLSHRAVTTADLQRKRNKHGKSYKFRVMLPHWLAHCIWELGMTQADGIWTSQVYSINLRPSRTIAFDSVRSGDIEAVRDYLQLGELSLRDREYNGHHARSLLEVSVDLDQH